MVHHWLGKCGYVVVFLKLWNMLCMRTKAAWKRQLVSWRTSELSVRKTRAHECWAASCVLQNPENKTRHVNTSKICSLSPSSCERILALKSLVFLFFSLICRRGGGGGGGSHSVGAWVNSWKTDGAASDLSASLRYDEWMTGFSWSLVVMWTPYTMCWSMLTC